VSVKGSRITKRLKMIRFVGIALFLVVIGISFSFGQVGSSAPFSEPQSSSSSSGTPPTSSAFGSGGVNPNGIDPPPDPIDTPIDAGVIFLLIIGTAYGVTRMRNENKVATI
jgi:hypothetical protein